MMRDQINMYPKPSIRSLKSGITFGRIEHWAIWITSTISIACRPIGIRRNTHFCSDPTSRTFGDTLTIEDNSMRLQSVQQSSDRLFQTGRISIWNRDVYDEMVNGLYLKLTRHQTKFRPNHHILSRVHSIVAKRCYRMFLA